MNLVLPITPAEAAYGDFRLPHRRQENWRWTDLHQLIDNAYPPAADAADRARLTELAARSPFAAKARLVIADGRYISALSTLPAGASVTTRAVAADSGDDPIRLLSDRFAAEELVLSIAAGSHLETPVEIVVLTAASASTNFARIAIELGEGASATVIETHLGGEGGAVATSITRAVLGKGASLNRVKVQLNGREVIHLANAEMTLGADARLSDFTLTEGGRATRQQGFITFAGEHAEARVSGAYLLSGSQHADTRLVVDHAVPHCLSRELFKCVMDGRARGIFQGKVIVRQDAQKTDGKQSSNALLLSEEAEFDAKPELEIYADDVVCGHGATSGALDEDQLFYLRARGVPEAEAESLLIAAFAGEAFDQIADDDLRDVLRGLAEGWLVSGRA